MNVLIVCATAGETDIFRNYLLQQQPEGDRFEILVTGVGGIATAHALTKQLQQTHYDLVIQAGVGGSFDTHIPLGEVVYVATEMYGDLGAEDHDKRLDVFEMGLAEPNTLPYVNGRLPAPVLPYFVGMQQVSGLTVNLVSGSEKTIAHLSSRYHCQVESMEGAAFHYVCLQEGVPFGQVRAISNYVTPRDKSQWKMKEAVLALNGWLVGFSEDVVKRSPLKSQ
jgi:futalosine hydrolase